MVPFLPRSESTDSSLSTLSDWAIRNVSMNLHYALDLVRRRVRSNDLGLVVDKAQTVVKQRYIGDINLTPPRQPRNALRARAP